jgi:hypothetical protein
MEMMNAPRAAVAAVVLVVASFAALLVVAGLQVATTASTSSLVVVQVNAASPGGPGEDRPGADEPEFGGVGPVCCRRGTVI